MLKRNVFGWHMGLTWNIPDPLAYHGTHVNICSCVYVCKYIQTSILYLCKCYKDCRGESRGSLPKSWRSQVILISFLIYLPPEKYVHTSKLRVFKLYKELVRKWVGHQGKHALALAMGKVTLVLTAQVSLAGLTSVAMGSSSALAWSHSTHVPLAWCLCLRLPTHLNTLQSITEVENVWIELSREAEWVGRSPPQALSVHNTADSASSIINLWIRIPG